MALGENSQLDLGNERLTMCCGVTNLPFIIKVTKIIVFK